MIKIQTFLVKSRNIASLLSDFNNCLKLLGGGGRGRLSYYRLAVQIL